MELKIKKDPTLEDAWEHYATVKDQTHGTEHIKAVLAQAHKIVSSHPTEFENIDNTALEYAAILHDIGHQDQTRSLAHGGTGYHPIIGVGIAKKYIKSMPSEQQDAILDAVQHHHGEVLPHTDIGKVVRDADRLVSTTDPSTLASRAYSYRLEKGMEPAQAAQSAYHYLRHNKLNRLESRGDTAFLTQAGKDMFKENVEGIRAATDSYTGFARLINAGLGEDEQINPMYVKTASMRGDLSYSNPAYQDFRDKTYIKMNEDLLKQYKGNKEIENLAKSEIAETKRISYEAKQTEKDEAANQKFDRDMAERKMSLEEKKVNAEIKNKKDEAKINAEIKNKKEESKSAPKSQTKTAGIFSFLHDIKADVDESKVTVEVPIQHNVFQDVGSAIKHIRDDDGLTADRKKLLGSAAVTAAGLATLGAGMYATIKSPLWTKNITAKSVSAIPAISTVTGLYIANQHRNDENKTMRNIGLGLAAAGGAASVAANYQVANKFLPYDQLDPEIIKTVAKLKPYSYVGSALTYPGIAALAHYGQKIEDENNIKEYLEGTDSYEETAKNVNGIREKRMLQSRYPLLRYFNTVPHTEKLRHLTIGKPAGKLEGKDEAYYIEARTKREFDKLRTSFEVLHGRATQEDLTRMEDLAKKIVMKELGEG